MHPYIRTATSAGALRPCFSVTYQLLGSNMFLKPEYEISFPMLLATSIASDPCSSCANMLIGKRLRSVQVYQKSYMQLRPKTYQLVGCVSVSAHMLLSSVYCMRCICIDITGVVLVVSERDCFFLWLLFGTNSERAWCCLFSLFYVGLLQLALAVETCLFRMVIFSLYITFFLHVPHIQLSITYWIQRNQFKHIAEPLLDSF